MMIKWKSVVLLALLTTCVEAKSDPGIRELHLSEGNTFGSEISALLANTKIYVKIDCKSTENDNVSIRWTLTERECWYDETIIQNEEYVKMMLQQNQSNVIADNHKIDECNNHLIVLLPEADVVSTKESNLHVDKTSKHPLSPTRTPIITINKDGIYDLVITIKPTKTIDFTAQVTIEIIGPHGYISALDWPLLPFYGIMCFVYVIFGIVWLVVSFAQWRDLLRIQFWVGGVILLGMLEKAFFYELYHNLNLTGVPVQSTELAAEFVSCAKRTLARMLVIIMSLGFGIVKPRLGPMLHRVVGVGALYFVLACVESYLRVKRTKTDERNELLVATIPLAVLDTGICWWIFTSLVQTTRTLRLRRNMVKLNLYRHFTNSLIFSVIASVFFMLYAMHLHWSENCTPDWHDIWIDSAFWHVLFSLVLLVIMILWRPTNNNQRYAFTPLLDNPEDEDDDEEDQFVADTYGVKMRGPHSNGGAPSHRATTTEEDDLRWVEDNIPSSMVDPALLPILDSDEEIINTKFEVSKMQ